MTEMREDTLTKTRPLLLAGELIETSERQPISFPYNGSEIGSVSMADEGVIEKALTLRLRAEPEIAAMPPIPAGGDPVPRRAWLVSASAERNSPFR